MRIQSEDRQVVLALERSQPELRAHPWFALRVDLQSRELSCSGVQAWFELDRFRAFLGELLSLDSTRRGEAVLLSMNPGEMKLQIFPLDSLGHVALEIELMTTRQMGAASRLIECGCRTTFELDPTTLVSMHADLTRLIGR